MEESIRKFLEQIVQADSERAYHRDELVDAAYLEVVKDNGQVASAIGLVREVDRQIRLLVKFGVASRIAPATYVFGARQAEAARATDDLRVARSARELVPFPVPLSGPPPIPFDDSQGLRAQLQDFVAGATLPDSMRDWMADDKLLCVEPVVLSRLLGLQGVAL
ncbi:MULTISPECIES: hypothetical protein [Paraburkholderia]|uniref:hypothetical protein n=1 Tax=Paraburkholderia TaxID=1822464 RepID=UPI0003738ABC|nr:MULTISPECIES: hypothetical protein [Paraburkholderia]MDH6152663.1 hypothetical protein [Paraburkholderia sp. WSM4179]